MAKLVTAAALGAAGRKALGVRVPLPVPRKNITLDRPNQTPTKTTLGTSVAKSVAVNA